MKRIKIGVIGMGDRGTGLLRLFRAHEDIVEVTGVYDTNRLRLEAMAKYMNFEDVPLHDTWEEFVKGERHDLMVVATPDDTHPDVIVKCLESGYHTFADKPLANTAEGLTRIMEAYDKADRMLLMGFNLRYLGVSRKMKEIAQRGELGDIKVGTCVHPVQGIRYFRRWHKYRAKSGGLVIHKGCHHIDIMNWVMASHPVEVYAQGGLAVFKGDKTVAGCHVCKDLPGCPYSRSLDYRVAQKLHDMYIGPSELDGYTRNYCPISSDADVPDFCLVTIRYANGACATYNEIYFSGKSRADWSFFGDKAQLSTQRGDGTSLERIGLLSGESAVYRVPVAKGDHGGADPAMAEAVVLSVIQGESRMAPPEAGVRSSVIGIAAMKSIDENRPVKIEELLPMEFVTRAPETAVREAAASEGMGYAAAVTDD